MHPTRTQHLTGADADALVFASPRDGPLNYQNFMLRIWKPAVTAAGLEGVTAHDLRHSAATYLDAVGAPEQLMRRRLGHGSSDITRRVYVRVLDETDKRITRALGELVWHPAVEQRARDERAGSWWHVCGTRVARGRGVGPTNGSRIVRDLRLRGVEVMGLEPTTSTLRTQNRWSTADHS
jgi:hypothetical protein